MEIIKKNCIQTWFSKTRFCHNGTDHKTYYSNFLPHRKIGPTHINERKDRTDISFVWKCKGLNHRINGPIFVKGNCEKMWYWYGVGCKEESYWNC